jgi:hypothetical protein
MILIRGKFYAVWPDENGGHVCESAKEIGWDGNIRFRPDYAGGTYDAPGSRRGAMEQSPVSGPCIHW